MHHSSNAIEARRLVKAFGDNRAVDGLDLTVPIGGIVGLLGPNGAGKTTTVRMLATLMRPDGGNARVFGYDIVDDAASVRCVIGLTGQFASIDDDLSGRENLVVQARLLGLRRTAAAQRADELLEQFELAEAARRAVKTYSGGMQRRLDIAMSLVVPQKLLFLDEPTTGLDPRSRGQVWDIVRQLVADGTTILLTTQYLEEADQLADRIVVVDRGRVVADDAPARLKKSVGAGVLQVEITDPARVDDAAKLLQAITGVPVETRGDATTLRIRIPNGSGGNGDRATQALTALSERRIDLTGYTLGQPSLDEVFLALTGHHTAPKDPA